MKDSIKRLITTMNLFKKESVLSQIANAESMSIKASRIYAVLLSLSILTIVVFKCSDQITVSPTILFPSLDTFEQLQVRNPNTLSCTCGRLGMFFNTFVTITPKLHQVCSSDFINSPWTTLLYGYNSSITTYQKFDRPFLSKYFQNLALLCAEAQNMINFWTFLFDHRLMLDNLTYTRITLETFVTNAIDTVKPETTAHFQTIIPFITEMFESNLLPAAFNTDWTIQFGNESNGYLTQSVSRLYMNNTCNCIVSNSCQDHLRVGPPDLILPGVVIGCSPMEGLRMSTLECFYSSDCISTILIYLDYYRQINGSLPNNFQPPNVTRNSFRPLDNSTTTRFPPNTSISTLINEMFIEDWIKKSSYEAYYNACAPSVCQYEYTKRQDLLYVTTSLLALYGGLTVGWRFIIWNSLVCYQWIKRKYLTRQTAVQPLSSSE